MVLLPTSFQTLIGGRAAGSLDASLRFLFEPFLAHDLHGGSISRPLQWQEIAVY